MRVKKYFLMIMNMKIKKILPVLLLCVTIAYSEFIPEKFREPDGALNGIFADYAALISERICKKSNTLKKEFNDYMAKPVKTEDLL